MIPPSKTLLFNICSAGRLRKADKETNPGSSKDVPPQTGIGHHACKPILALERLKQEDCGELEGSSDCRASPPTTRSHRAPTASRFGNLRLFPRSPGRVAGKAAAQRSAGRRASRPHDPVSRPGPRSIPPRPSGTRRSPGPGPRRPGAPHLAFEAPGKGGIGRTPQAAALPPTDSISPALPAHGACAERGGGLPPILTRDCTPAHLLLDAATGPRQSTGVHLCPNKRALTPNQACWACPKKAATNHDAEEKTRQRKRLSLQIFCLARSLESEVGSHFTFKNGVSRAVPSAVPQY